MNNSVLKEMFNDFISWFMKHPVGNSVTWILMVLVMFLIFFMSEFLPATQNFVMTIDEECNTILKNEWIDRYYDNLPLKWSKDLHTCIGHKSWEKWETILIDRTDNWQEKLKSKNINLENKEISHMSNFSISFYKKFLKGD